ncbi:MAG TPA: glycosyltransferase [Thermoanaerobaculia bacterium]|nr:glycosyltransferase [Thermoanaerobaculia bacterium]
MPLSGIMEPANRDIALIYVVQSEMMDGGVIESQVIAPLRAQAAMSSQPRGRAVFLEAARVALSPRARRTLATLRSMWPEGRVALLPFVSRLGRRSPSAMLALHLLPVALKGRFPVFHCRGPAATITAHGARERLGLGRVVYDLRGAHAEETIHRLGHRWPEGLPPPVAASYEKALEIEREAVQVADFVFAVSPGLRQYAVERLGADPSQVAVVPSCVEETCFDEDRRTCLRKEWGIDQTAPVFVYSGRLGPERLPRLMLEILAAAHRIDSRARLVLFTYLDELGREWLDSMRQELDLPEAAVIHETLSRDEVMTALSVGDFGFLLYQPASRYRRFQAPIKVGEYLACGLGLIVNEGVGEVPQVVKRERIGWILGHDWTTDRLRNRVAAMVEELRSDGAALRRRALATCSRELLWRCHEVTLRSGYGLVPKLQDPSLVDLSESYPERPR